MSVTSSPEVLVTAMLNVTMPPGAGTLWGEADLSTSMVGGTSSMATSALSNSSTLLPSSSTPVAAIVSLMTSPPLPPTKRMNEQV